MTIPTTTMYRVSRYRYTIEPVQVIRTTKTQAYILNYRGEQLREALNSSLAEILPSWEQAHERLLLLAEEELHHIRRELDRVRGRCGNIARMKKP